MKRENAVFSFGFNNSVDWRVAPSEAMSIEITTEPELLTESDVIWEPPAPPDNLIFDDGEPLESNRHRMRAKKSRGSTLL